MNLIRFFTAIAFTSCSMFLGCSSVPIAPSSEEQLIGCWYGEDYQPLIQRYAGWLMNRKPDGRFTIEFRTIEKGVRLPIQMEEGHWTYRAGKYVTLTTRIAGEDVDTSNPQYTDEYEVKSINGSEMVYFHPGVNQTFKSRRVACDYQAP
jgi:hypothetical protein